MRKVLRNHRGERRAGRWFQACCRALTLTASIAWGDELRLRDSQEGDSTLEARIVMSERGATLIELDTGEYRLLPNGAILDRKPKEGPDPMTAAELSAHLCRKFPAGLTRSMELGQYSVVVVLGSPLKKAHEPRVKGILTRATKFLKNVETVYGSFCKQTGLAAESPRLPLGMLIFETERDFDEYAGVVTGRGATGTGSISGFYSGLTNLLAMRLSECLSFEVPAHEAMHQQSYNRGTFQRLAPIPHWLDEGLATGFETIGAKINGSPYRISTRYARQALDSNDVSWDEMLAHDEIFLGDVLAGEAYGQAWGLHWLLLTKHKQEYARYARSMAAKRPLQEDSPEIRLRDFQDAFGKPPNEFESEFLPTLNAKYAKFRKLEVEHNPSPGVLVVNDGLADVEVIAERAPGPLGHLTVKGRLRNTSPIRPMSYRVSVRTDSGQESEWYFEEVPMNEIVELEERAAANFAVGPGGFRNPSSFSVQVRSTPPDSREGESWKGKFSSFKLKGGNP